MEFSLIFLFITAPSRLEGFQSLDDVWIASCQLLCNIGTRYWLIHFNFREHIVLKLLLLSTADIPQTKWFFLHRLLENEPNSGIIGIKLFINEVNYCKREMREMRRNRTEQCLERRQLLVRFCLFESKRGL
ncbi:Hypothetical_protein [Hexamita inflata]|uniref:Hypothetical_protein n=1 Tax=Hexamita inflata TaxID=28002 RepID=A0AA86U524_9EUKA|nr:Hypothetical protein HINF_LOCUS25862 [Hexamita inflata]